MPNSAVSSMGNFLLLQQAQNKLDSSPLHSPVHNLFASNNNNLNTAQLYSSSPSSVQCPSLTSTTIVVNQTGLLNSSNNSMLSAYGPLNFTQQSTPPLSLASTASSLAITAPLHTTNQSSAHQTPFVHLSQLNNQQQYSTSNYYYSTLQPANRRVRVISNNLNGLTTIDDLHMHTDV